MKTFAKFLSICAAALLLGASVSYGAENTKIFPVGALFAMSGPQSHYGRVMSRGAQMAIDHLNASGGVEGYTLKLEIADFQNVDVNLALTGLQKMISTKHIPFLLSSFSAITLAAQPICAGNRIVVVNGGAFSPDLADKPYLHNIRLSQAQTIPPMLKYLWEMNIRKPGVIYFSGSTGEGLLKDHILPIWTQMGGNIVAKESHPLGATNFSTQLSNIKASGADAIYGISTGQDQAYFVKQAREAGMNIPITVTDWTEHYQTITGKTSENVYLPIEYFDHERPDSMVQQFVKDYQTKWNELPDMYAANYYDSVYNILAELIRRTARSGGNPLNGEELEKAIKTDPSFKTLYGEKLVLNQDGTCRKPIAIMKIADGKKTVLKKINPE